MGEIEMAQRIEALALRGDQVAARIADVLESVTLGSKSSACRWWPA
jgi:hypothetical protein